MALPPQVQAALAAAEATLAEVNAPPVQSFDEPAADTSANQDPFETQAQAAPQPEVEAPAPVAPPKQVDEYEARYKTLQGIFNKTVPELQGRVKDLESNLSDAVARLNRASAEKEQAPTPTVAEPKDVDNFGSDLVEMVQRVAQSHLAHAAQVIDAKVAEIDQKIAALAQQLSGTTQAVAVNVENAFFERLTKALPEWESINADPGFLAWLAEEDPVHGVARQHALNEAQKQLNSERALAVFRAYAGPAKAAPKVDPLEKQMSPRSASSAEPVAAEKTTVSQAQITTFYNEVRQGRYRGNEAEAARIEQIINTALAEGRVT